MSRITILYDVNENNLPEFCEDCEVTFQVDIDVEPADSSVGIFEPSFEITDYRPIGSWNDSEKKVLINYMAIWLKSVANEQRVIEKACEEAAEREEWDRSLSEDLY